MKELKTLKEIFKALSEGETIIEENQGSQIGEFDMGDVAYGDIIDIDEYRYFVKEKTEVYYRCDETGRFLPDGHKDIILYKNTTKFVSTKSQ